jgi:hypothetical protein
MFARSVVRITLAGGKPASLRARAKVFVVPSKFGNVIERKFVGREKQDRSGDAPGEQEVQSASRIEDCPA